ncbi:MATE family efflux transporter [Parabacteroides sp. AM08-6]|uniref:MATE family efflux transporter n=1 Tax=Parabacteroides sp. AM08-6 TaxID=2292053 RepID=UPI000EFECEAA|nr:MATE family efflux transporter [Parabacteroides sp. AM08-6]RHJ85370.1 MATE family efflux transporter [Parabacteroides sp. AM08-6]
MIQLSAYKEHYKETIRLGVPIMLGQLGIIIVGFADNIMVGHHSTPELAAASFVNNFFNLIFIAGMGFSYGLTPIIGGLYAQKEYARAGEVLKNSLFINFIVGILLSICMLILLFNIRILQQPEELLPYIIPYYILQLFSVIFAMLFNSFKQFSDGTTDTLTPMWVMLSANVFNIIGNYLLIYGKFGCPELGLTGAGISTLSSRILTLIIFCFLFLRHSRYRVYLEGFKKGTINMLNLGNLMRLGLPVGFQMGVETGSFSLSVIMMGWIGSTALAAHQVVGVITTIGFMIYYGIAAAVTIRVSAFKGWKDWLNVRRASFAGLHLIMAAALLVVLLILSFRTTMGYLITPEKEVVELVALLAWSVILYQFGDGLQILFANALRGISDVKYMAYMAFLCHFGLALPIGYLCGFTLGWGSIGVWCGFPVSLTTLGILLWRRFNKLTTTK